MKFIALVNKILPLRYFIDTKKTFIPSEIVKEIWSKMYTKYKTVTSQKCLENLLQSIICLIHHVSLLKALLWTLLTSYFSSNSNYNGTF